MAINLSLPVTKKFSEIVNAGYNITLYIVDAT